MLEEKRKRVSRVNVIARLSEKGREGSAGKIFKARRESRVQLCEYQPIALPALALQAAPALRRCAACRAVSRRHGHEEAS